MIDLEEWTDRNFTDLIAEMVNEINNLNIELQRIKKQLQYINKSEVL